MTVAAWLQAAEARLRDAGFEAHRIEAQVLAAEATGRTRSELLAHAEDPLEQIEGADARLERRIRGEPLAYILGRREFYGRSFRVGPGVLVPRHETETLVDLALSRLAPGGRVLDLGTGSGCIAATLALEIQGLGPVAIDISPRALAYAAENVRLLGAAVRLVLGDAVAPFSGGAFDLLVTNPPYVGLEEPLPPDVGDWEPREALFAGAAGLEFFRRLAVEAPRVLARDGLLMAEMGQSQAVEVAAVFAGAGWRSLEVFPDLGGTPRVLSARVP